MSEELQKGDPALIAAKKQWYAELLALDPDTPAFLNYARFLSEIGKPEESVGVLRRGLEKHPDMLDARLFLIKLLAEDGSREQAAAEAGRIASLFRGNAAFWESWSENEGASDFSSLLKLTALFIDHDDMSFSSVVSAGIDALKAGAESSPKTHSPAAESVFMPKDENVSAAEIGRPGVNAQNFSSFTKLTEPAGCTADAGAERIRTDPYASARRPDKCSLRTRTMADILLEQGDVSGALDIYEELLADASPEDEAGLRARVESLRELPSGTRERRPNVRCSEGVADFLDKLAVRLETKACQ